MRQACWLSLFCHRTLMTCAAPSVHLQVYTVYTQVGEDEAAGTPATGVAREGGDTPSARKCTYMELALCLAPGLDVNGITILYKAAKPALQVNRTLSAACSQLHVFVYLCALFRMRCCSWVQHLGCSLGCAPGTGAGPVCLWLYAV